ncbi:hypothetical protein B0I33_110104 [Prauserella shujinwangii]|uniref:2'-5' RNA ligase superfamily protein n=1 Tax=Prauserella shujinwangii TaxID=1453103 RepID=A0A2T0LP48_9PSEU|nr:2'-5' RNA ligase family protein [Prauserella shujinwangii]PRX45005.1 hypothetical protein B0I33_110104 [Prauserella shujinwangii]
MLPDAEPLLDHVRRCAPELVRPLPAHVSLLYPGPDPDPDVLAELRGLGDDLSGEVELRDLLLGDDGFLGIAVPELDPAATWLRRQYPRQLPYHGRFGANPPAHLTLTLGAGAAQVRQVQRAIADALPSRSRLRGPYLVERTDDGWRPVEEPPGG